MSQTKKMHNNKQVHHHLRKHEDQMGMLTIK